MLVESNNRRRGTNDRAILTMREAAEYLRCSKAHWSNIINGLVPGLRPPPVVRIGRRYLIRQDSLEAWVKTVER